MPDQWTTSDLFEEPEKVTEAAGQLTIPEEPGRWYGDGELKELLAAERNKGYDEGRQAERAREKW